MKFVAVLLSSLFWLYVTNVESTYYHYDDNDYSDFVRTPKTVAVPTARPIAVATTRPRLPPVSTQKPVSTQGVVLTHAQYEELVGSVAKLTHSYSELKADVSKLMFENQELRTELARVMRTFSETRADVDQVESRTVRLEDSDKVFKTRLDGFTMIIGYTGNSIGLLNSTVLETKTRVKLMEKRLTSLYRYETNTDNWNAVHMNLEVLKEQYDYIYKHVDLFMQNCLERNKENVYFLSWIKQLRWDLDHVTSTTADQSQALRKQGKQFDLLATYVSDVNRSHVLSIDGLRRTMEQKIATLNSTLTTTTVPTYNDVMSKPSRLRRGFESVKCSNGSDCSEFYEFRDRCSVYLDCPQYPCNDEPDCQISVSYNNPDCPVWACYPTPSPPSPTPPGPTPPGPTPPSPSPSHVYPYFWVVAYALGCATLGVIWGVTLLARRRLAVRRDSNDSRLDIITSEEGQQRAARLLGEGFENPSFTPPTGTGEEEQSVQPTGESGEGEGSVSESRNESSVDAYVDPRLPPVLELDEVVTDEEMVYE